jgi:hypothetical protein
MSGVTVTIFIKNPESLVPACQVYDIELVGRGFGKLAEELLNAVLDDFEIPAARPMIKLPDTKQALDTLMNPDISIKGGDPTPKTD